MTGEVLLAGQSGVWVQPGGPNTKPQYLGCHQVGDISEDLGSETLLYKPDPARTNEFLVKGSFKGAPGAITFSVETDVLETADYLETLSGCAIPFFVHKVICGRRDDFSAYARSFVLGKCTVTKRGLTGLAVADPGSQAQSKQTFDFSARTLSRVFKLKVSRITVVSTEDLTGIAVAGTEQCAGNCGPLGYLEDVLYASAKHVAASASDKASVYKSIDKGATWAASAADPLGAAEDIQGVVAFPMGSVTRVLVARGTTDAGNPPEIAYTDDGGASWTLVNVNATNAEFVSNGHALFALDRYHIWLGLNTGKTYFSGDGGASWTLQSTSGISATAIVAIVFVDASTGFLFFTGGQGAKTTDGGVTWSATAVTGSSAVLDASALDNNFVWVVGTDGMYYTMNGGTTWVKANAYPIGAIDFLDDGLTGVALGSGSNGKIYQTIDGGYDWEETPAVTNGGFVDVVLINARVGYVAGKASGGSSFLGKVQTKS